MLVSMLIVVLVAYLVGSIPFGLVLTKLAGRGDIRSIGSGNIGATNVLRTGSKPLAFFTLLLDAGKGAFVVGLAQLLLGGGVYMLLAAIASVAGHMFSVWLKGKGGKGVATALAVIAVLIWPLAVIACAVWLMVFLTTRISSLSAIAGMLAIIVAVCLTGNISLMTTVWTIALAVIVRHHENIRRLLKGEESSFKKAAH